MFVIKLVDFIRFQKGASSEKFFSYLMKCVLPTLDQVAHSEEMGDFRLELLKLLVEISPHVTEDLAKEYIDSVFQKLLVSSFLVIHPFLSFIFHIFCVHK